MAIDFKSLAPILDAVGKAADAAGTVLPGPASLVSQVVGAALRFAADLAKGGHDPIERIERLHAAEPLLKNVEDAWARELERKFGKK